MSLQTINNKPQSDTQSKHTNFVEAFLFSAERYPSKVAASCQGEKVTYKQLNDRVNNIAHCLALDFKVGKGDLVGVFMQRSIEMLATLLAILKSGAAYLPLDSTCPEHRLLTLCDNARISILVIDHTTRTKTSLLGSDIKTVISEDLEAEISSDSVDPQVPISPQDPAYVIYTSGSTGLPKGVLIPHRGLHNYLLWCAHAYPLAAGSGSLVHSSISFDATITSLFAPLLVGKEVELISEGNEIEALAAALKSGKQYSLIKITPTHLRALNSLLNETDFATATHSIVIGGEALLGESLQHWLGVGGHTRFFNEYGPTEAVVGCCVYEVNENTDLTHKVPIGRSIGNTQIHLMKPDLTIASPGEVGEIYIAGEGLADGYLYREDLTADRFKLISISDESIAERMYATGDLACQLKDGNLVYLGRLDEQIKIRGYRIEPEEICVYLRNHASIKDAAVVATEENGTLMLCAYLVREPSADLVKLEELKIYLEARLPSQMIPAKFYLVENLPITTNGKLDKIELLKVDSMPLLPAEMPATEAELNATEILIRDVWQEILNSEITDTEISFFELGGDSILGIQAIARINKAGFKLKPRDLIKHQTISALAKAANASKVNAEEQVLLPGARQHKNSIVPTTPIQRWFLDRNTDNINHYNFSILINLPADFDTDLFSKAIQLVIDRHEVLSYRFTLNQQSGIFEQRYTPMKNSSDFWLENMSVADVGSNEGDFELEEACAKVQRSLDISAGPVCRFVHLQRPKEKSNSLFIVVHHLVIDGVSWRILLEDLLTAYQQKRLGTETELSQKAATFEQWTHYLHSNYRPNLDFWLRLLKDAQLTYPLDYPILESEMARLNVENHSADVTQILSKESTEKLLQHANSRYGTKITELLLAAFNLTLRELLGAGTVYVDLDLHGRIDTGPNLEISDTVGWFTSLFPFPIQISDKKDLAETIKSTKESVRTIPDDGLGYGVLRYLQNNAQLIELAPKSSFSFNYLGQFSMLDALDQGFSIATENTGSGKSGNLERETLVDILGSVQDGSLRFKWTYSEKLHKRQTIKELSGLYVQQLERVIEHCSSAEGRVYTPSDFPLLDIEQSDLDSVLSQIERDSA